MLLVEGGDAAGAADEVMLVSHSAVSVTATTRSGAPRWCGSHSPAGRDRVVMPAGPQSPNGSRMRRPIVIATTLVAIVRTRGEGAFVDGPVVDALCRRPRLSVCCREVSDSPIWEGPAL